MLKRQVALDTETTGKSDDGTPGEHRIIEVGCVEIIDRKITGRQLQLYVNPERPVDEEAYEVHGISNEFLADKPKFAEVADQLIDFIRGSELLIHNAKFDVSFMDKEWQLLNLNETTTDMAQVTDTVSLAMKLCPGHQVNLDNLCNLYDVDRSARTIHGALLDAQILAEVYLAMTGGQGSLEFSDAQAKAKKVWQRPNGAKLPLMQVEDEMMCVHIDKMISLSQARPLVKKEGEPPMAGSTWSHDYDMPYLEKGEDESKGDYKKRLKEQKLEMMDKLLNKEQQEMLKAYQEREQKAYKEWEDRVLGNTK
ncbi:MAG: DNA polymerase III subunit epsilon [Succinivibrio sp.]|nr:DNA polymerase III subunit epsilon [Succinivibrio sp.]MBQ8477218.1 DNA polymerase III subunit epsilon [Succinivibrio sp.]HAO91117.1 DNA polymerase III subunit epsilon [Succinivibrio sp.]